NSASNPAKPGGPMILYVAGIGQSKPPSPDGRVNVAPYAPPAASLNIEWFGSGIPDHIVLPIAFAGAAPNLVAGIYQVNFTAPDHPLMNVNFTATADSLTSFARFNVFVSE